jgi:hypothetical protein
MTEESSFDFWHKVHNVHTHSEAHPASSVVGTEEYSTGVKRQVLEVDYSTPSRLKMVEPSPNLSTISHGVVLN